MRGVPDAQNDDRHSSQRPRYEEMATQSNRSTRSTRSSSFDEEEPPSSMAYSQAAMGDFQKLDYTVQYIRDQAHPSENVTSQQESCSRSSPHNISVDDQIQAKRDEVTKARLYLQQHCDPNIVRLGHIPASWKSGEKGDINDEKARSESSQPESSDPHITPHKSNQPQLNIGEDGACSPRPSHQHNPTHHPQSQQTENTSQSLSIPESALAPSLLEYEEQEPTLRYESENLSKEKKHKGRLDRDRRKARIEAFLAARDDSYDSWADLALVSAGDHGEEELEL